MNWAAIVLIIVQGHLVPAGVYVEHFNSRAACIVFADSIKSDIEEIDPRLHVISGCMDDFK